MKTRPITTLALAQIGLVVFGYLFTVGAVKVGFPEMQRFDEASWVLRNIRYYGLLMLAVPVLWATAAVWAQHRESASPYALYGSGIALTAFLAVLFVYSVGAGFFGPPIPHFMYIGK